MELYALAQVLGVSVGDLFVDVK